MNSPVFDASGNFQGFEDRECGDHRTVGEHRAWCHEDTTWCYPNSPCPRCELPQLRAEVKSLQGDGSPRPSYRMVHIWLNTWRGKAADQTCADCGQTAHDWAFDNRKPNWPSKDGPYYPDPGRYVPLCRTCHIARDTSTEKCKNGHRWADGNRYKRKGGGTICRACRREWMARASARRRALREVTEVTSG